MSDSTTAIRPRWVMCCLHVYFYEQTTMYSVPKVSPSLVPFQRQMTVGANMQLAKFREKPWGSWTKHNHWEPTFCSSWLIYIHISRNVILFHFSMRVSCWEFNEDFTVSSAASLLESLTWPEMFTITNSQPTRYFENNTFYQTL